MIVSGAPRPGHAWRAIATTVLALVVWDIAVTVAYYLNRDHIGGYEIQISLFGTAIALFIGFMVNAAYARWWEARTLWGAVVNSSRSLGRRAVVFLDGGGPDARADLPREVVRATVAYAHVLRTSLRRQELPPEAEAHLGPAALARIRAATNRPAAVLLHVEQLIGEAGRRGMVGEMARVELTRTVSALTDSQGGLERIKNTPLPAQYRFLPRFFARVFCVVLPFAVVADLEWATPIGSGLIGVMFLLAVQIGDDLADPFEDEVHDVPMTALTRTIEIDLAELGGLEVPEPVRPVGEVLW